MNDKMVNDDFVTSILYKNLLCLVAQHKVKYVYYQVSKQGMHNHFTLLFRIEKYTLRFKYLFAFQLIPYCNLLHFYISMFQLGFNVFMALPISQYLKGAVLYIDDMISPSHH